MFVFEVLAVDFVYYSYYCSVVAKAFESAGMLLDVCSIFGEPNEGEFEKKK